MPKAQCQRADRSTPFPRFIGQSFETPFRYTKRPFSIEAIAGTPGAANAVTVLRAKAVQEPTKNPNCCLYHTYAIELFCRTVLLPGFFMPTFDSD